MRLAIQLLAVGAMLIYLGATCVFLLHLLARKADASRVGTQMLVVAFCAHALSTGLKFVLLGGVPVRDPFEGLNLLALALTVCFIYIVRRYGVPIIGAFAAPLAFVTLGAALAFGSSDGAVPDALRSVWFPVHLVFAISGDALFLLAGVMSLAYLLQERMLRTKNLGSVFRSLPPLHLIDEIGHRLVVVGWFSLTIGMAAGAFFAKQKWGAYWSWDPKQTATAAVWLLFAAILHARITIGWRGRRVAYMTLIAVAFVVVLFLGLGWLTPTRHMGDYQ